MKKITIINSHLLVGSIEKYITNLANLLLDEYEIELIIIDKVKETPLYYISNKIKITYVNDYILDIDEMKVLKRQKQFFKLLKEQLKKFKTNILKNYKLLHTIRNIKSDYIITTRLSETKLVNKYLKNKNISKIAFSNIYPDEILKKEMIDSLNNFDKFVVPSQLIFDEYKKELKNKVVYIPNYTTLDINNISNLNTKNLISLENFKKEKQILDLIDIMKKLVKHDKNISLTLIGDGEQRNLIIEKINELHLEKNIKLTGYMNELETEARLINSSIYVMCGCHNTYGSTLINAMGKALPIVAFDSSKEAIELINNTGILIKNRNKDDFVKNISELLEDEKKLKKYSKKSLQKAKLFDEDSTIIKWNKLLKNLKIKKINK